MKKLILTLSIMGLTPTVFAKTEIEPQLEKLKANAENSESNYKQYQDNLDIVTRNIKQAGAAETDLKKLETQLLSNVKNVEKNKAALVKQEKEVEGMKTEELGRITKEEKQIADLKLVMEKIQKNIDQRKQNIMTYDQKIADIQTEGKAWDTQVQEMSTLQTEIKSKQTLAKDEKAKWVAKQADYKKESQKWKVQASTHKSLHNKYK